MKSRTSRNTLMIFAFFTGLFLAVSLAAMTEYLSNAITMPRDMLQLPFLGSLPKRNSNEKKLIGESNPKITNYAKSFQILSEQVSLLLKNKKIKALLITDAEGSQETAIISANLGTYFAHTKGLKVLIIDADLRASSLSEAMNMINNIGLAGILEEKSSIMNEVQDLGLNLYILTSGKTDSNPAKLLDTHKMQGVINQTKEVYDLVIISCPDLKNYTDPCMISYITDGTILVVNEGEVRRQIFDNAIAPLKQKNVNILGTILNNRKYVIPEIIYKAT